MKYSVIPAAGKRIGRPRLNGHAMTGTERWKKHSEPKRKLRLENIGVIDMETDPFDNAKQQTILPFCCEVYSPVFEKPYVIWDENFPSFVKRLLATLDEIYRRYGAFTFYAHNGGKFDFLFLIHELRGAVNFKGRGLMSAKVCGHELRDSFHIIPERLAAYQKTAFDYKLMTRGVRHKHKEKILAYQHDDCVYLFDLVRRFIDDFGLKLSIGQAAMTELKQHYTIKKFSAGWDEFIRQFYFGGRVECLQGAGDFRGPYKLYDKNSQYPDVMARFQHPVGDFFDYEIRRGDPGPNTCFVDLDANNFGRALVKRGDDGSTTTGESGHFKTTIWEFNTAVRHGLIRNVDINFCIDCKERTDFSKFVLPLYQKRMLTKRILADLKAAGLENTPRWIATKIDDLFYKLLLNNAYGKTGINPRNFKEHYLTDPGERPPAEWFKSIEKLDTDQRWKYVQAHFESDRYSIWHKPAPGFNFVNVGVAASVTGAARASLVDGLVGAVDAIYCDTDSIICRELRGVEIHKENLGAWDLEDEFTRVRIGGKKLYETWHSKEKKRSSEELERGFDPRYTIKAKGNSGLNAADFDLIMRGDIVVKTNRAPTFDRYGGQKYLARSVKRTATVNAGI